MRKTSLVIAAMIAVIILPIAGVFACMMMYVQTMAVLYGQLAAQFKRQWNNK